MLLDLGGASLSFHFYDNYLSHTLMFHVLFCTGIIFHNEKGLKSIYTYALFSGGIQWQTVNGGGVRVSLILIQFSKPGE